MHTGVMCELPRTNKQHRFHSTIVLERTKLSAERVADLISHLVEEWPARGYHWLRRNCCDFANELCGRLGVGRIPPWIDRFARGGRAVDNAVEAARSAWGTLSGLVGANTPGAAQFRPAARPLPASAENADSEKAAIAALPTVPVLTAGGGGTSGTGRCRPPRPGVAPAPPAPSREGGHCESSRGPTAWRGKVDAQAHTPELPEPPPLQVALPLPEPPPPPPPRTPQVRATAALLEPRQNILAGAPLEPRRAVSPARARAEAVPPEPSRRVPAGTLPSTLPGSFAQTQEDEFAGTGFVEIVQRVGSRPERWASGD